MTEINQAFDNIVSNKYFLICIIGLFILFIVYITLNLSFAPEITKYNWMYTTNNQNSQILILIIIIFAFIILDFGLWKKKIDRFYNVTVASTTKPATTKPATTKPATTKPTTTKYQTPTLTKPDNNMYLNPKDRKNLRKMWVQLDGDEETLAKSDATIFGNTYTLNNSNTSNTSVKAINYDTLGDYATIDDLGKSLTDTLGGIKTNIGYTLLDEQLGTFKPNYKNANTYDNTLDYKTGMNPDTVDGVSTLGKDLKLGNGSSPIFLQKDFAGVANIFAPNIIIANPPLNSDGIPDISFDM
jgi:hypothetical protein